MAVGDLNGDGMLDIVAANSGSATVSVLLGPGDGTFTTKVDYPTGRHAYSDSPVGNSPNSLALGDLDGDGGERLGV